MNYRHGFHAGNAADVFKHCVLCLILKALQTKPTPFFALDSHAGAGGYRLFRGGEHEQGIDRLWGERDRWPDLADYFQVVSEHNPGGHLKYYPGSPLFIRALLRGHDRAAVVELHPQEHAALRALLHRDRRIGIHLGDGWNLSRGFTPPPENRGLVLIDPPYEERDDFERVVAALARGQRHWRNGVYCAWYPIKSGERVRTLRRAVAEFAPDALAIHFLTLPQDVAQRLNGSGLIIVNPPWRLRATLNHILPPLAALLAGADGRPQVRIELVGATTGRPPH